MSMLSFGLISATGLWLLVATGSALAIDERTKLAGYEDLLFGTTEADLRKQVKVVRQNPFPEGAGTLLKTDRVANVGAEDYHVSAVVNDGVVARIRLARQSAGDVGQCKLAFTEMVEVLKARYGSPDGPSGPSKDSLVDTVFRFSDGGTIVAAAAAVDLSPSVCLQLIDYVAGNSS